MVIGLADLEPRPGHGRGDVLGDVGADVRRRDYQGGFAHMVVEQRHFIRRLNNGRHAATVRLFRDVSSSGFFHLIDWTKYLTPFSTS